MGVSDHLEDGDGTTTGSSSMALVERAPWALNSKSYIGTADTYGLLNSALNDPRSGTWTMPMSASERGSEGSFGLLPPDTQAEIDRVAKQYNSQSTGESLWKKATAGAAASTEAGKPMTAFEWLSNYAARFGRDGSGSGSDGSGSGSGAGSGGYAGPRRDVDYQNAPAFDVRSIADAVSMEMLGRGVEQDEMERILSRVRKYENRNPAVRVSQAGVGSSVSRTQGGATNAGRQEVIERMLAKNPEFGDYQQATTLMGWFDEWLTERGQASG